MPIPKNVVDGVLQQRKAEREAIEADLNWMPGEPPEEDSTSPLGRRVKVCPAPVQVRKPAIEIEAVREIMGRESFAYIKDTSPTSVLLFDIPPGTGKTWAGIKAAEEAVLSGRKVLFAGPRHEFFLDIMRISKHPELWYEWLPRQLADDEKGKEETCRHAPYINTWLAHGYPAKEFCRQICGWDYFNLRCPYQGQRNRKEPIIFGQHQHIFLGHPMKFSLVIGDESPLAAVYHEWQVPARHILPDGMPDEEPLAEILYQMQSIAMQDMKLDGPVLLAALGGATRVRQAVETLLISPSSLSLAPTLSAPQDVDDLPYFHLGTLGHLLLREATAAEAGKEYPHRLIISDKKLLMLCRHTVNDELPSHVIWLDATANQHIYETIFERPVKVINPHVKPQGRIIQVTDRANGLSFLFDKDGKKTAKLTQLVQQVDTIAAKYQTVGVITHMSAEEEFSHYADRGHFFAARGTNRFDHVDALVIAGLPQPPTFQIDRVARMLFFNRMEPFYSGPISPWSSKPTPFQYVAPDGMGRTYPKPGFWADPDLDAVLWQFREAEIIQAIHRARPNLRAVDIWLLENLPVEEQHIDRLIEMREIFDAPRGVSIWDWPKVSELIERYRAEKRAMTMKDIEEQLGLHRNTASKYWQIIRDQQIGGPWSETPSLFPEDGKRERGRPRLMLVPRDDDKPEGGIYAQA